MTRRLIGNAEVLDDLLQDPEFRLEWGRTALARAVAEAVIRYRRERGLSQTALARLLGWSQPVVARLEAAEHNPSMDTWCTCRACWACGSMWMWDPRWVWWPR
jgi:DNA-binding XRE family transcriptional regulator